MILRQIEDIPIDFSNRKNIERILAFLDYCYGIEEIREKVINSPKLTFSLIDCLDNIQYEHIDNFEALYDIWRICIKYFSLPNLHRQPYFDKLKRVIHSKCCLLHNPGFIRVRQFRDSILKSDNIPEKIELLSKQYNVAFEFAGDFYSFTEVEISKVVAVVFFLRLKLINMILSFYNMLIESQGPDAKSGLVIEMNVIPDGSAMARIENKEDQLNLSLLTHVLDLLFSHLAIFKLWDLTFTISETMYLIQKLIDHSESANQSSKTVFNYLSKLIDADLSVKHKTGVPIYYFGEDEPKSKSARPVCYLKNLFLAMEILPTSDLQTDTSQVILLQKVFDQYDLVRHWEKIVDDALYQSLMVVLSRIEVNLMSMQLVDQVFCLIDACKAAYPKQHQRALPADLPQATHHLLLRRLQHLREGVGRQLLRDHLPQVRRVHGDAQGREGASEKAQTGRPKAGT